MTVDNIMSSHFCSFSANNGDIQSNQLKPCWLPSQILLIMC